MEEGKETMQEGAFALLDCLGFKGIWERVAEPNNVVSKFRNMEKDIPIKIAELLPTLSTTPAFKVATAFLSDTVIVAAFVEDQRPPDDLSRGALKLAASLAAQTVAKSFCADPIPLVLRGCITYGQFLIDGTLILGPSVDDAATLHQISDGAFIWIDPKFDHLRIVAMQHAAGEFQKQGPAIRNMAASQLKSAVSPDQQEFLDKHKDKLERVIDRIVAHASSKATNVMRAFFIEDYPMPLKGGQILRVTLIVPSASATRLEIEHTINQYEKGMSGDRLDVVIKRQRTLEYLQYVRSLLIQRDAEYAALANQWLKAEFDVERQSHGKAGQEPSK